MINNEIIKKLWEEGVSVEDYYYLLDVIGIGILSVPMGMANLDRLRSKGYLDKYAPTAKAHALIDDLQGGSKIRELFTEYWTTYPVATSDGRELRHSYTTALELYREALTSYGHAYLIDALKREIAFRNSTPSKLKYMKGITAYLSTREYLNLRPEIATAKAEYGKTIS